MKKNKAKTSKSRRFTSTLERSENKLWGCHVRVPRTVAKDLADNKSRRVSCSLNGSEGYQCAILRYGKGASVISVNKTLRTRLGLDVGSRVEVVLVKDNSTYGLPVPKELSELFRQDEEGKKLFHDLTRGKQRTLLYIVGAVNDPDKRLQRSLIILKHLKEHRGTINYKRLSVSLKDPRRPKPHP